MARRLAWIEAARTLACVLVVLAHVNIHTRAGIETWWPGGFAGAPILALSVPIFFIIAGYIADLGGSAVGTTGRVLATRLQRLLLPFFTWNALTLLALTLTAGLVDGSVALQLMTGTWHLYFIFALVQLLAMHALIQPLLASRLKSVLAIGIAATAMAFAISEAVVWTAGADDGSFEVHGKKPFFVWAGFFLIGVWWRRRGLSVPGRRRALVFAAAAVVAYTGYVADLRVEDAVFGFTPRKQLLLGGLPFQLLGAIGALAILQWWERTGRGRGVLEALGRPGADTFGIYLSHIVVLAVLWKVWEMVGGVSMSWVEIPLFTLATWTVSRGLVRSARALRIHWLSLVLLGERTSRPPPGTLADIEPILDTSVARRATVP